MRNEPKLDVAAAEPGAATEPASAAVISIPSARPAASSPADLAGEANWNALGSRPVCPPSPAVDAGATIASSSTVDWSQVDGGANAGSGHVRPGTVSNAAQVVAGMRPGFRSCYQRELAKNGQAAGSIRLMISVACDGSVAAVHGTPHGFSNDDIECLFETVRRAQFDPPEGGSAVIAVPITFVNKSPH